MHFAFVFGTALLLFFALKATIGLRVTPEEEIAGLDIEEHGHVGYGVDIAPGGDGGSVPSAARSTITV